MTEPLWYLRATGQYHKTTHWRDFRAATIAKRDRCEACGASHGLVVHHLTYDRVGCERQTDVAVLCDPCHNAVHCLERTSRRSPEQQQAAAYWRALNPGLVATFKAMVPSRGTVKYGLDLGQRDYEAREALR
jgi:hypothetical protein